MKGPSGFFTQLGGCGALGQSEWAAGFGVGGGVSTVSHWAGTLGMLEGPHQVHAEPRQHALNANPRRQPRRMGQGPWGVREGPAQLRKLPAWLGQKQVCGSSETPRPLLCGGNRQQVARGLGSPLPQPLPHLPSAGALEMLLRAGDERDSRW